MTPWVRCLFAVVVGCHGFLYARGGPGMADTRNEWTGRSWLLGRTVTDGGLKTLAIALSVISGIATVACAGAIVFAPSLPGWWRPLATGGGVLGVAAFVVFWDGRTRRLLHEGAVGAVLNLILAASAVAFPLAFG